ncbi:MAG: hypothetical protein U0931_35690 [Vulcanimicrobiota bacterium]
MKKLFAVLLCLGLAGAGWLYWQSDVWIYFDNASDQTILVKVDGEYVSTPRAGAPAPPHNCTGHFYSVGRHHLEFSLLEGENEMVIGTADVEVTPCFGHSWVYDIQGQNHYRLYHRQAQVVTPGEPVGEGKRFFETPIDAPLFGYFDARPKETLVGHSPVHSSGDCCQRLR